MVRVSALLVVNESDVASRGTEDEILKLDIAVWFAYAGVEFLKCLKHLYVYIHGIE